MEAGRQSVKKGDAYLKTKLAKLLWLSDFCHYAKHGESITGLVYCRLPYGPTPDQYYLLLGFLESDGLICRELLSLIQDRNKVIAESSRRCPSAGKVPGSGEELRRDDAC